MKILKAIIGGALMGAAVFFVPFMLIRVLLFVFVIGAIFRILGRGRWGRQGFGRRGFGGHNQFAFADYIRGMSDDEYNRFRKHFGDDRCNGRFQRQPETETKSSN